MFKIKKIGGVNFKTYLIAALARVAVTIYIHLSWRGYLPPLWITRIAFYLVVDYLTTAIFAKLIMRESWKEAFTLKSKKPYDIELEEE